VQSGIDFNTVSSFLKDTQTAVEKASQSKSRQRARTREGSREHYSRGKDANPYQDFTQTQDSGFNRDQMSSIRESGRKEMRKTQTFFTSKVRLGTSQKS
jgi:hypothetical protein